jgi:hypothetical protein
MVQKINTTYSLLRIFGMLLRSVLTSVVQFRAKPLKKNRWQVSYSNDFINGRFLSKIKTLFLNFKKWV